MSKNLRPRANFSAQNRDSRKSYNLSRPNFVMEISIHEKPVPAFGTNRCRNTHFFRLLTVQNRNARVTCAMVLPIIDNRMARKHCFLTKITIHERLVHSDKHELRWIFPLSSYLRPGSDTNWGPVRHFQLQLCSAPQS